MIKTEGGKILYIHIGHNKTGSSYVQSIFANSVGALQKQGLVYPNSKNIQKAKQGGITTGNILAFSEMLKNNDAVYSKGEYGKVFSSELFFKSFIEKEFQQSFCTFIEKNSIISVKILLFIRDPVSLACSRYQQLVKGHGLTGSIEAYFEENFNTPKEVNVVLDFFESLPIFQVTVKNYSREKKRLLSVVEEWLEVPSGTLNKPPQGVVNRSLTFGELELQRFINFSLGASPNALANHVSNNLPDIRAEIECPSIASQEKLWNRLALEVDKVNSRIAIEDNYDHTRDISERIQNKGELFGFSKAQIEVIADCIVRPTKQSEDLQKQLQVRVAQVEDLQRRLRARIAQVEDLQQKILRSEKVEVRMLSRLKERVKVKINRYKEWKNK